MKQEINLQCITDALTKLEREYNRKNLTVEIAAAESGRIVPDPTERKIQEYSLSSSNRRRFLMYVIRAGYEEEQISWKQLYQLLNISRNALQTMIGECVGNEWVIEYKGNKKTDSTFIAAETLIKTYDNYSAWMRRSCRNVGLRTCASAIIELQALIDIENAKNR